MLTLSSSNLLAERPYTKIRKDIEQGPQLALDDRISLFRKHLVNNKSDIFLFQKVDEHWENVLNEFLEPHGYFILIKDCRKLKWRLHTNPIGFKKVTLKNTIQMQEF